MGDVTSIGSGFSAGRATGPTGLSAATLPILSEDIKPWIQNVLAETKNYFIVSGNALYVRDPLNLGRITSESSTYWMTLMVRLAELDPANKKIYSDVYQSLYNGIQKMISLSKADGNPGVFPGWVFTLNETGLVLNKSVDKAAANSASDADMDLIRTLIEGRKIFGTTVIADKDLQVFISAAEKMLVPLGTYYALKPSEDWNDFFYTDYFCPGTAKIIADYCTEKGLVDKASLWTKAAQGMFDTLVEVIAQKNEVPARCSLSFTSGRLTVTTIMEQGADGMRGAWRLADAIPFVKMTPAQRSVLEKYVQTPLPFTKYFAPGPYLALSARLGLGRTTELLRKTKDAILATSSYYGNTLNLLGTLDVMRQQKTVFATPLVLPDSIKTISASKIATVEVKPLITGVEGTVIDYESWKSTYVRRVGGHTIVINNDIAGTRLALAGYKEVVVSEGLGYGLLLAVQNNDLGLFQELMATIQYLSEANYTATQKTTYLLPWVTDINLSIINKDATQMSDSNPLDGRPSAADADLDIIAALIMGAKKFAGRFNVIVDQQLNNLINRFAQEFMTHDVAVIPAVSSRTAVSNMYVLKQGAFIESTPAYMEIYPAYAYGPWFQMISAYYGGDTFDSGVPYIAEFFRKLAADSVRLQEDISSALGCSLAALPEKVALSFVLNGKSLMNTLSIQYVTDPYGKRVIKPDIRNPWRILNGQIDMSTYEATFGIPRGATGYKHYFYNTLMQLNKYVLSSPLIPATSAGRVSLSIADGERNPMVSSIVNTYKLTMQPRSFGTDQAEEIFFRDIILQNIGGGKETREKAEFRFQQFFLFAQKPDLYFKAIDNYVSFRDAQYGEKTEVTYTRLLTLALSRVQANRNIWDKQALDILVYLACNSVLLGLGLMAVTTQAILSNITPRQTYIADILKILDSADNSQTTFAFSSEQFAGITGKASSTYSGLKGLFDALRDNTELPIYLKQLLYRKIKVPADDYAHIYELCLEYKKKSPKDFSWPWEKPGFIDEAMIFSKLCFNYPIAATAAEAATPRYRQSMLEEVQRVQDFIAAKIDMAALSVSDFPIFFSAESLRYFHTQNTATLLTMGNLLQKMLTIQTGLDSTLDPAKKALRLKEQLGQFMSVPQFATLLKDKEWQAFATLGFAFANSDSYTYGDFVANLVGLLYWSKKPGSMTEFDTEARRVAKAILEAYKKTYSGKPLSWEDQHSIWAIDMRITVEETESQRDAVALRAQLQFKAAQALQYQHFEAYANILAAEARLYTRVRFEDAAKRLAEIQNDKVLRKYVYIANSVDEMKLPGTATAPGVTKPTGGVFK